jgi:EAL domain-containing protein (putative c-di-GMP-specific phosphodiesterase class I)
MSSSVPGLTLARLEDAAAAGQLYLMYQPKLDLRSGAITGVEALSRWQHPRRGAICPTDFVPAFEKSGLIDWFTQWVLTTAARQWNEWHAEGLDFELAINISAHNLRHVGFPDVVVDICRAEGLNDQCLTLELTEGATQEATRLMDTVSRIRLKGIGISFDDFGTGYGSLVQLRCLPFTELKIDRRFVSDLLVSADSRAITRGLIGMAHDIGLSVTAEGVEDHETLSALQAFGCDKAQGFLIARPMTGDRLPLWLSKWDIRRGFAKTDQPGSRALITAATG